MFPSDEINQNFISSEINFYIGLIKVVFESSPNKYFNPFMSFGFLRISNEEFQLKIISLKIINGSCHLSFNETCSKF